MGESLWDLYREAGLAPSAAIRAAREGAPPPLTPPIRSPAVRRYNERQGRERYAQAERRAAMDVHAMRSQALAPPRNQIAELPELALEATGLPSVRRAARGYTEAAIGIPTDMAEANENAIWGAFGVGGWAVPGGRGARPSPRVAPRAPPPGLDMAELGRTVSGGLSESDTNFLAMMGRDGEMPTPEEALGRPLTPEHIFNDPRFNHRMALTHDLDRYAGSVPPEQRLPPVDRFRVAGERIEASLPPERVNDLDRWRADRTAQLPDLIQRQREIGPGHDTESLIHLARNTRPGEFASILDSDLGNFGVGGTQEHTPLLGTPDISADPMVARRPPGMPPREPFGALRAPNEDRYLFGRPNAPPPMRTALDAGDAGGGQFRFEGTPEDGVLRRADDMGAIGVSRNAGGGWRVGESLIDEEIRGQGHGMAMYEEMIRRARADGAPYVESGRTVSGDARNVYAALERRGYAVERLPGGRFRVNLRPPALPDGGAGGGGQNRVTAYRGASVPYEGNPGVQFWSSEPTIASANALGEGANVMRADLDLGRTLVVDAQGRMWDDIDPAGVVDDAVRREFSERIHVMDPRSPRGAYGWHDVRTTDRLAQIARRHGYDSVTFRNVVEGGSEVGAPGTTNYAIIGDRVLPIPNGLNGGQSPPRPPPNGAKSYRSNKPPPGGFSMPGAR